MNKRLKKLFAAVALVIAGNAAALPASVQDQPSGNQPVTLQGKAKKQEREVSPFYELLERASDATQAQVRYNRYFLERVFQIISQKHVEKPSLEKVQNLALEGALNLKKKERPYTMSQFVEAALDHVMQTLDPHSDYFTAQEMGTTSWKPAIFMDYEMDTGAVRVLNNLPETAHGQGEVKAGDVVTHIDGQDIRAMKPAEITKKIEDKKGLPLNLTLQRSGASSPVSTKVFAASLVPNPVSFGVYGDIGYIRIEVFNPLTVKKLEYAVETIKRQSEKTGLKGYILDLRDNPGGYLGQAIGVVDSFVNKGAIVSTGDAKGNLSPPHLAKEGDILKGAPLVVLTNGNSASASEIVAGALQSLGRATIMGQQTFGKGSVQEMFGLDVYFYGRKDGMKITTNLYYMGSGETIQNKGVIPDIRVDFKTQAEQPKEKKTPRRESDFPNAISNPRQNKGESSAKAACEILEIKSGSRVPMRVFEDGRKELDAEILCAFERLRGESRHTQMKPLAPAEALPAKKTGTPGLSS